jgi:hypothetical protein
MMWESATVRRANFSVTEENTDINIYTNVSVRTTVTKNV